jgi:hypothetical protein
MFFLQFQKVKTYAKKQILNYLAVFLFFLTLLSLIQFSFSGLLDTDPYYHLRHAALYREGLSPTEFPWVRFTPFVSNYTDLWYGYHRFLSFFTLGNLVTTAKWLIAIIGALFFLLFYHLLRFLKISYPFFWTFVLFVFSPLFLFRLLLLRPHVIDLIFLLLSLWALFNRHLFSLFFLTFLFAFFHQLAPILFLVVLIFSSGESLIKKEFQWQPVLASFLGLILGILIHPNPLMYLYGIWLAFIKIPFFSFLGQIQGFGREVPGMLTLVKGKGLTEWFISYSLPLWLYFVSFLVFLFRNQPPPSRYFPLWLLTSFWLIITMITGRGFDFFIPLLVLQGAIVGQDFLETRKEIFSFQEKKFWLIGLFLLMLSLEEFLFISKLRPGFDLTPYEKAGEWLKENTPSKTIVLLSSWDIFPYLFYSNQSNWYTTAHDPIFLYEYDPKLYWLWFHLISDLKLCEKRFCQKEESKDIVQVIKYSFRASYFLINEKYMKGLVEKLKSDSRFRLVFRAEPLAIFALQ